MSVFASTFRVRNRKKLNTSLHGTTLGDADGDTDDALKWIRKSKELNKNGQEERNDMDEVAQDEYSESKLRKVFCFGIAAHRPSQDLVGLKVSHDFERMDEGDVRIL